MARCLGADSPYGCGHHDQHVRAAKLGWLRRRHVREFSHTHEHRYVHAVYGDIEGAHRHESHRGLVTFRQRGKWYEVPASAWRDMVRIGRETERETAREQREAERQRKRDEKDNLAAANIIARYKAREERITARAREAQERMVERMEIAGRRGIMNDIKKAGGIRSTGKHDAGEVRRLPAEVRRKNGHFTLDTAREHLSQFYPHIKLDTPDDLLQYFERSELRHRDIHRRRQASRTRGAA